MKRLFLVILAGIVLAPSGMFADKYNSKKVILPPHPIRMPAQYFISFYLDEDTGEMSISPNYDITGLRITITGNNLTYLDTTVSLNAGQAYIECIDYLDEGEYILTLSTADSVIDRYIITVERD